MAHNINFNETTASIPFFSVKEKHGTAWAQVVDQYPTSAEAIQFAGLDFTVVKQPLFTTHPALAETQIEVPEFFTTDRTDTAQPLGIIGSKYHIVQNVDAFSFFDSIVEDNTGILYETAGALGNGERIFITAKLPGYLEVGW